MGPLGFDDSEGDPEEDLRQHSEEEWTMESGLRRIVVEEKGM